MKMMILTAAAVLSAATLAGPSRAGDEVDAATQDKITAQMTAEGYEVRKIEMEDGMIEVYAVKDGHTYELYLDADLKVVKSKEAS